VYPYRILLNLIATYIVFFSQRAQTSEVYTVFASVHCRLRWTTPRSGHLKMVQPLWADMGQAATANMGISVSSATWNL
jgi:hypothetical protein